MLRVQLYSVELGWVGFMSITKNMLRDCINLNIISQLKSYFMDKFDFVTHCFNI